MPGFLSSRSNWVPPIPYPQDGVAPLPLGPRGETLSLAGEKVGGPNSDDGTDTLVLQILYHNSSSILSLFIRTSNVHV
jgi:hypothetical protein